MPAYYVQCLSWLDVTLSIYWTAVTWGIFQLLHVHFIVHPIINLVWSLHWQIMCNQLNDCILCMMLLIVFHTLSLLGTLFLHVGCSSKLFVAKTFLLPRHVFGATQVLLFSLSSSSKIALIQLIIWHIVYLSLAIAYYMSAFNCLLLWTFSHSYEEHWLAWSDVWIFYFLLSPHIVYDTADWITVCPPALNCIFSHLGNDVSWQPIWYTVTMSH